jgi:hypothetical protein
VKNYHKTTVKNYHKTTITLAKQGDFNYDSGDIHYEFFFMIIQLTDADLEVKRGGEWVRIEMLRQQIG